MADPYYWIDIPRLVRSHTASRKRLRWGNSGVEDDSHVKAFFVHLGDRCRTRGDKARLREAIHICISLLDGHNRCPRGHCKEWSSRYPMDCQAGKNPRTCKDCKAYLEKKAIREAQLDPEGAS